MVHAGDGSIPQREAGGQQQRFAGKLRYYRSRLMVKELKKWYPDSWLHSFLRWGKRAVFKILRLDRRER